MSGIDYNHPAYEPSGYKMINSIEIKNFKSFEHVKIDNCRRVNLIVGDNGQGKTALLEGIFFALGRGPELALRYRAHRGFDNTLTGPFHDIEEALWRDLFFKRDWTKEIYINLSSNGPENRSVRISRADPIGTSIAIPLFPDREEDKLERPTGLRLVWRDHHGKEYVSNPVVNEKGLVFDSTGEDQHAFYYFPVAHITQAESARRFSKLSKSQKAAKFVRIFTEQFDLIEDISVEEEGGNVALFATIKGLNHKMPLASVSAGIGRMVSIMLGVSEAKNAVVLIDEIENGIYYKHMPGLWKALNRIAAENNSQIIATTHSEEWLHAVVSASDDPEEVALWRVHRKDGRSAVAQFAGRKVLGAIEAGEVR